jgi:hypothetical protein
VEQLEREYKTHALGALKNAPLRGSGKVRAKVVPSPKSTIVMYVFIHALLGDKDKVMVVKGHMDMTRTFITITIYRYKMQTQALTFIFFYVYVCTCSRGQLNKDGYS